MNAMARKLTDVEKMVGTVLERRCAVLYGNQYWGTAEMGPQLLVLRANMRAASFVMGLVAINLTTKRLRASFLLGNTASESKQQATIVFSSLFRYKVRNSVRRGATRTSTCG